MACRDYPEHQGEARTEATPQPSTPLTFRQTLHAYNRLRMFRAVAASIIYRKAADEDAHNASQRPVIHPTSPDDSLSLSPHPHPEMTHRRSSNRYTPVRAPISSGPADISMLLLLSIALLLIAGGCFIR